MHRSVTGTVSLAGMVQSRTPPPATCSKTEQVASVFMASCDLRLALACKKAWYSFQGLMLSSPGLIVTGRSFTWIPSFFTEFVEEIIKIIMRLSIVIRIAN